MKYRHSYKPRKSLIRNILEWIVTIVIAVFVSLFIVSNIASLTQIKEQSMEPTFYENDRVIINKFIYLISEPARRDIVILNKVQDEKGLIKNMVNESKDIFDNFKYRFTGKIEKNNLIKRVVGVNGDIIDIRDGYLYINGQMQEEEYAQGNTYANGEYPMEVPTGMVFVLGDNRENSLDSRNLGFVNIDQIKGKAVFRVFPFNKFGTLTNKE